MYEKQYVRSLCIDFAIRIVRLNKYLLEQKNEYVMSKQILRSGTSIGANISEAEMAQSTADFIAKMHIALKEANETKYWLELLQKTDYITIDNRHFCKCFEKEKSKRLYLKPSFLRSKTF